MTKMIPKTDPLYEIDFVAWCEDTATKLRMRDIDNLDFDNLIEEVESLGRSERRELRNRLTVLICHILKRMYVNNPENFNGWELTIIEQRRQIKILLQDSPSLKPYLAQIFAEIYSDALDDVRFQYRQTHFPSVWEFSTDVNSILFDKYW